MSRRTQKRHWEQHQLGQIPTQATGAEEQPAWARLIEHRAIREGWSVGRKIREMVLARLQETLVNGENREATIAAKVLLAATREESKPDPASEGLDRARWDWYGDGCPCNVDVGQCKDHPRARAAQRPPAGDWRTWLALAGRGWGKTRCGAEWVRSLVETRQAKRLALVAPTAADIRDVLVEGESGILAVSPPWFRPDYEPSKRRLTWPNGAIATTFSAEEPERLRGPQHDAAWCDELGTWPYRAAWDNLWLGLRLGTNPRALVTTTPRATDLLKQLVADVTIAKTGGTTYENRAHLPDQFFDAITGMFEGTRLGRQELYAELLEIVEGQWFGCFDPAKHVSPDAEYQTGYPVRLAIDAGVSQHTGAVFFQVRPHGGGRRVCVFGDFYSCGTYSAATAAACKAKAGELCYGGIEIVRLDPAASAQTGVGPAAYAEYEKVFGQRTMGRWPSHGVVDGLDQVELLLDTGGLVIHPRCKHIIAAFQGYRRAKRGGRILDYPEDPQHPHEDLMDALRGGIRDLYPEGFKLPSQTRQIHAGRVIG